MYIYDRGTIAKELGLTDTAGAFAAGVLLANTNYRAQVQADILPFKGILLGIFFMDAGSSFDLNLVLAEFPTVITGVLALILLKGSTVFCATKVPRWMEPNRLPERDAVKLSFLLAGVSTLLSRYVVSYLWNDFIGFFFLQCHINFKFLQGGEFAFVVLAVAERLDVLPRDLGGLLTAIVLITMAFTPLLGDAADRISDIARENDGRDRSSSLIKMDENGIMEEPSFVSNEAVVVCGYGEIGKNVVDIVGESNSVEGSHFLPRVAAFDTDPALVDKILVPKKDTVVLYGDGANPEVLRSSGVTDPSAIFISYQDHAMVLSATSRLRNAFEETPIFARAQTRFEAQVLKAAGATEVVVESDELPRSAMALLIGDWERSTATPLSRELLQKAVAKASGIKMREVENMLDWFKATDTEGTGLITQSNLLDVVRRSKSGVMSDEEIEQIEEWILNVVQKPLDYIGFCRLFVKAPDRIKEALKETCIL